VNKNGFSSDVHVVAKNLPWALEINSNNTVDLTAATVTAQLFYQPEAEEEGERPVDGVHKAPLEYRTHVNSKDSATLEFRIKVLTSQLQSLFRVKIQVKAADSNKKGKDSLQVVHLLSNPIKVVSKPSQATKKRSAEEISSEKTPQKKTTTEVLLETLARLEQQGREHQVLLEQLSKNSSSSNLFGCNTSIPDPSEEDFETAFKRFLNCFNRLGEEERPRKIRKMAANMSSVDNENLSELVNILSTGEIQSWNNGSSSTLRRRMQM